MRVVGRMSTSASCCPKGPRGLLCLGPQRELAAGVLRRGTENGIELIAGLHPNNPGTRHAMIPRNLQVFRGILLDVSALYVRLHQGSKTRRPTYT